MLISLIFFFDYLNILFFLFLIANIIFLIILFSRIISIKNLDIEKLSSYECGFNTFISTREKFNISFILIAILFLIFDLEIIFLLPWILYLKTLNYFSFFIGFGFIILIIIGFLFEWLRGVLSW